MKTILTILAFAIISCSKSNSTKMSEVVPLKAVPTASVNGRVITLSADKSTGDITQYGWQLEDSSPTGGPVTYAPSSSKRANDNGIDFTPITATVTKTGMYKFRLTVYDKSSQDYNFINVDVK